MVMMNTAKVCFFKESGKWLTTEDYVYDVTKTNRYKLQEEIEDAFKGRFEGASLVVTDFGEVEPNGGSFPMMVPGRFR